MNSAAAKPDVIVFTSPKAGSGGGRDQIDKLLRLLNEHHHAVWVTDSVVRLDDWLSRSDRHAPSVVVTAGGDGTVGLAASRIVEQAKAAQPGEVSADRSVGRSNFVAALTPMPMGTENLLARHFGYRCEAEQVLRTIQQNQPFQFDMGLVGTKPFLCMTTCGFDAEVVRSMHLTRRGHIRKIDYAKPIFRALRRYDFPTITIESNDLEDGRLECGWAMAFNLPCYAARLQIQPDAVSDDGLLDVVVFRGRRISDAFRYVSAVYRRRHFELDDVMRFRTRDLRISANQRVPYQVDGDYGGRLPIELSIVRQAVTFLRPATQ